MEIKQFRYGDGNLAYLVYNDDTAAAIDGGAVDSILKFVEEHSLNLKYVLNTHDHADHTPGNKPLIKESGAQFFSTWELAAMKTLKLGDSSITIFSTPGHTMDSIVFSYGDWMITGDTLFNGTVGNCYSEKYEKYFKSLERIITHPTSTRIFAGHDLVNYALGVVEKIEPDNQYLDEYRNQYDTDFVVSSLEMELKVNPFIRFNDSSLDSYREKLNMPLDTPYERWRAMMTVH